MLGNQVAEQLPICHKLQFTVTLALEHTTAPAELMIYMQFRPAGRKTRVGTHRGQQFLRENYRQLFDTRLQW